MDYASIGRVVSDTALRREGHGRALMTEAIRRCRELFGDIPLKISAQVYLTRFYESLGFHAIGEPYLEDFIDHIAMIRYWQ
jgi:ElaA protein